MNPVIQQILEDRYQQALQNNQLSEGILGALEKGLAKAKGAVDELLRGGKAAADEVTKVSDEVTDVAAGADEAGKFKYSESPQNQLRQELEDKTRRELQQAEMQKRGDIGQETEKIRQDAVEAAKNKPFEDRILSPEDAEELAKRNADIVPTETGTIKVVPDTAEDLVKAISAEDEALKIRQKIKAAGAAEDAAKAAAKADEAAKAAKAAKAEKSIANRLKKAGKAAKAAALAGAATAIATGGSGKSFSASGGYSKPQGSSTGAREPGLGSIGIGQFSRGYVLA
jgi:membrane protein involved in colicin uptake